jgi:two-component system, OmpR family, sensor histidine kinase KdpD
MDSQNLRPNPDDLLHGINQAEQRSQRGRLRVFFGMCPGVGKTYSMLKTAREQLEQGVDVVVGVVETHGREETHKLLEGFEIIPKRETLYRSARISEMDIDAIIKRSPMLVIVDELAHTNSPDSRHNKRYQDVEELILKGIDVYTTLNVQHIESRADLVYQITQIPVQEKVPDSFLELADQIELIDISPEVLIQRLEAGKVYLEERALQAKDHFFKLENIIALRELALRFTAEKVDEQLRSQRILKQVKGIWNTNERLMVAVSHSSFSARLIRAARRMAYNLEAPWIAVYVDTGEERTEDEDRKLAKNLSLAKELGAEVVHTTDKSVAPALQRVAQEKNVTQIVIGRPDRRLVRDFIEQGTLLDHLLKESSEIDVHVIRQDRRIKKTFFELKLPQLKSGFFPFWFTFWFIVFVTFVSYAFLPWIGYRAVGFIYLASVLAVGSISQFGPILFAAALSSIVWNYFFIPPQFTFAIKEPEDLMNFVALFVVAFVSGYLTSRIKKQEKILEERARKSDLLYEFGKRINEATKIQDIANTACKTIDYFFSFESAIYLKRSTGVLMEQPLNQGSQNLTSKDMAVASWSLQNKKRAGWGTDTLGSSSCVSIPLTGKSGMIGVLIIWPYEIKSLTLEQENLIETICSHLAIALEREHFESKAKEASILEKSEILHQALLNSVSHELRTPLTAIVGNTSALALEKNVLNAELRQSILLELSDAADRLNKVVENLLDMSRISSGTLKVNSELFDLNDFVRSTIQRHKQLIKNHKLKLELSEQEIIVSGDDKLLEHVLTNIIINACNYSPFNSTITIQVKKDLNKGLVSVIDEGAGLPYDSFDKVFERFYRVPGTPAGGTGLGLSIAKALVQAHNGEIYAQNREPLNGSIFTFSLPLKTIKI